MPQAVWCRQAVVDTLFRSTPVLRCAALVPPPLVEAVALSEGICMVEFMIVCARLRADTLFLTAL